MLTLYHSGISPCAQKARLVLAHKGLEYESHELDLFAGEQHDPEYVKLNPSHVVPTLVHDGAPIIESTLIMEYLDDVFPDTPMRSADPVRRHAARLWIKKLDSELSSAIHILSVTIGARPMFMQLGEEALKAHLSAVPDPASRAYRQELLEKGIEAPQFPGAIATTIRVRDEMDAFLQANDWLSGEAFGLADTGVAPYVLKLEHLAMTPVIEARPHLTEWFARVKALPAYKEAVDKWLPPPIVEGFRKAGEAVWPDIEQLLSES